jgi:hypothetical protein
MKSALFLLIALAAPSVAAAADAPNPPPATTTQGTARAPASNFIGEIAAGYGAGMLSDVVGQGTTVAYGFGFHVDAGWAFEVGEKRDKSFGVVAFGDGIVDDAASTQAGAFIAGRYGVAGVFIGDVVHGRMGVGWSEMKSSGVFRQGWGLSFGVGAHVNWDVGDKHPGLVFELDPTWDLYNVGSQTLHRWGMMLVGGFALY